MALRAAACERGLTDAEVARRVGITPRRYNFYVNDSREPPLKILVQIADVLRVSVDALLGRTETDYYDAARSERLLELAGEEFATLPLYEPTISAGQGDVVEAEAIIGRFAFRRAWLRARGIAPQKAALFRVRGESMAPTILDAAVILVDRAATQPKDGRIYVVRQDDALYVKRLRIDRAGNLVAISDNPRGEVFCLERFDDAAAIIGEVRWFATAMDRAE